MMYEKAKDFYNELIAKLPHIKRKGKTMPYTSANGYMFTLLNKAGEIGIRLPKERQNELIKEFNTGPFISYGATMKDYVCIPEEMHQNIDFLISLVEEGFQFVNSLPPK